MSLIVTKCCINCLFLQCFRYECPFLLLSGNNMLLRRKLKYNHAKLLICLLATIVLVGCNGSSTNKQPSPGSQASTLGSSTTRHQETAFRTDSFNMSTRCKYGTCDIHIDYPVEGPEKTVSAIRDFIKSTLFEEGGITHNDDPQTMVHDYCEESQERQRKMLNQMGIEHVSEDNAPEEGIDMRVVCITPKFVTYEIYRYSYITHGAHGEYSDYGVTFRMKDGHRFSDDLLNRVDEGLYSHIREGMKHYFGVRTDEALEAICTADLSLLPMPTFPPYLVRDGVRFHFSIYDICPFEQGDPVVTIPYEIALPYLTEAGRAMVTE